MIQNFLDLPERAEVNQATRAKPDRAARLRALATGMDTAIDYKRRRMTQNPTPKRMREYNSRLWEAENMARVQRALWAVADAIDAGTLPEILADIKSKKDVEPLVYKGLLPSGYYEVHPDPEYRDNNFKARSLRALMEGVKTAEQEKADAERAKADRVRDLEERVRFVDIPGFFPTPRPLVERMIHHAYIQPGMVVLEPSAGKGDIADVLRERGVKVHCIEIVPDLRGILIAKGHTILGSDFLDENTWFCRTLTSCMPAQDRIIQNPPFEKGADMEHVRQAYGYLAPAGRLVSLMSPSPFFRTDKKSVEFREWFKSVGGHVEDVEAGAFSGPGSFRQTGVSAKLVIIDRREP